MGSASTYDRFMGQIYVISSDTSDTDEDMGYHDQGPSVTCRHVFQLRLWPLRRLIGAGGTWRSDWPESMYVVGVRARSDR